MVGSYNPIVNVGLVPAIVSSSVLPPDVVVVNFATGGLSLSTITSLSITPVPVTSSFPDSSIFNTTDSLHSLIPSLIIETGIFIYCLSLSASSISPTAVNVTDPASELSAVLVPVPSLPEPQYV